MLIKFTRQGRHLRRAIVASKDPRWRWKEADEIWNLQQLFLHFSSAGLEPNFLIFPLLRENCIAKSHHGVNLSILRAKVPRNGRCCDG